MVRLNLPSLKRVWPVKSKKVVLFIVEGPSDQSALSVILSKVFNQNEVFVYVVHGDVTTEKGVTPQNIVRKVYAFIKDHMSTYRLRKTDMLRVVHLMDTDGAYAPDEAVTEVLTVPKTIYNPGQIIAADRQKIIDRNERKRANMDRLALLPEIAGIPYLAVYMSCNLDHVLYNRLNSYDSDKRKDSIAFARKYRSNIQEFISFINDSDFSVTGGRKETWEYIKIGKNSLDRHTNLGVCFP